MKRAVLLLLMVFWSSSACAQKNVFDLNRQSIEQCDLANLPDELRDLICDVLRPVILEDLDEAENFLDVVFVGFDKSVPPEFVEQISPIQIDVTFDRIDGPGGFVANAGPLALDAYPPNDPEFVFITKGQIILDADDILTLIEKDRLVDVVLHEALHATAFPFLFQILGLIDEVDEFKTIHYVGVDGGGYAIEEFRIESGDPLAPWVPLEQATEGAHLCPLEPTFVLPEFVARELMTPFVNSFCTRAFMTRTLRGMYADAGFAVTGINAPGIIDLNQDGLDDDPLIVSPGSGETTVLGDLNGDGNVDLIDVAPFVSLLNSGEFACEADMNLDGIVNLEDVEPFVEYLSGF